MVLVGEKRALRMAVKDALTERRCTGLCALLSGEKTKKDVKSAPGLETLESLFGTQAEDAQF